MKQAISGLGLSTYYLGIRDFTNARKHALLAKQTDPSLSGPDQVLAVANVLLAASRRLPNDRLDFYSILQTRPGTESSQQLMTHFESLVKLLNKNKLPFSDDALNAVSEAWSVLSDPEKKAQYDNEINLKDENDNFNVKGTFWTVCPYCYYLYEYESVYEECCLRCQKCRRAFHGVAVVKPVEEMLVEGKDEYFCGFGYFPLKYCLDGSECKKDSKLHEVLEIPDDSDADNGGSEGMRVNSEKAKDREVRSEGIERKRVKTVARKSKKVMGRGAKRSGLESVTIPGVNLNVKCGRNGSESSSDCSENDFEFVEQDGDVLVGLKRKI